MGATGPVASGGGRSDGLGGGAAQGDGGRDGGDLGGEDRGDDGRDRVGEVLRDDLGGEVGSELEVGHGDIGDGHGAKGETGVVILVVFLFVGLVVEFVQRVVGEVEHGAVLGQFGAVGLELGLAD